MNVPLFLKRLTSALALCLAFWTATGVAVQAADGEALFKGNCGSCHMVDKKMTGPALRGVHDRWDGKIEEMIAFVQNSQAYMKAGRAKSAYASALYAEYNNTLMPPQALNAEEITSILEYIKTAPAPKDATADAGAGAGGEAGGASISDEDLLRGLMVLAAVLLFVIVALVFALAALVVAIRAKREGATLTWERVSAAWSAFFRSGWGVAIAVVVLGGGLTNHVMSVTSTVGFHQGYKPVQPVAFSHKLHAGKYEIDCKYCHVGVEKGKSATIPSANICMNCHSYIEEGPSGKGEIAKVREAYEKGKPIEWVRVHNLPDLVYFNHAQHVKVGGLECEECHGKVEEMDEVYQHSTLMMGWCVECHRTKEVPGLDNNEYYKQVHSELIEEKKAGKKVTVETIGGLECARCHY